PASSGWSFATWPGSSSSCRLCRPPEKTGIPQGTQKRKRGTTMAIHDDLDQLLKNLKLKKIREVLPRELERAVKNGADCAEFLSRLLREAYLYRQGGAVGELINPARLAQRGTL